MLPVIQSLWIGADLSNVEKLCVQSFLDHGHEFHLYTYGHVGGIPERATIKDANEILPESAVYRNRGGSLAGFSDWFRFALLSKRGNFWVDMDVICIQPFAFDSDIVFGWWNTQAKNPVQSAVLACPAGHILMQSLDESCRNHNADAPWDDALDRKRKRRRRWSSQDKEGQPFGRIGGPDALHKAIRHFGLLAHAKPFMYFYPAEGGAGWQCVFDRSFADGVGLYPNTYSIHVTNENLRRHGIDKNARFDEGSLFEQLKKKHGIENAGDAPEVGVEKLPSSKVAESYARQKLRKRKSRRNTRITLALLGMSASFLLGWLAGR